MLFVILFFLIGLGLLLKGADWLVDGASSLALRFHIAPIVIGLTIVAFGTSSPELVSSVVSAMKGSTGLAFGNVIGSNIMNILIVLGISAMVYPLRVHTNTAWKEIPMSLLGAMLLVILGLQTIIDQGTVFSVQFFGNTQVGEITLSNGLVLLFFFIIFMYYTFGIARVTGVETEKFSRFSLKQSVLFILLGLVGLGVGSTLLVDNAIILAHTLGVSDTLIGLTVVALGTSFPELLTSVVAARKKQTDIAVGNVIGSNIFNIFLVLGTTALVRPITIIGSNLADILVLFMATLFLFISAVFFRRNRITRIEGAIMVIFYLCYVVFSIVRG